jgi:O-antigen ligase
MIWETTGRVIADTFPAGTGFGTFPTVYPLYENPAAVGVAYINNAHNDYLELVLEAGLPGLVLIALFLLWWGWQVLRVWRSPTSSQFAKAATIASAAILAHSIVDYPLRTAAIAALFAACIAMMAQAQAPARRRTDEPRHVRIA